MSCDSSKRMQFHEIGRDGHSAEAHHITTCMHDHSHSKLEGGMSKASWASAKAQQVSQNQGEGQISLWAWLEKNLAKGRGLLRSIWGSSQVSQTGEPGDKSGQAQVMAQIGDSREADAQGRMVSGQESLQPDVFRTLPASHVAQAAAAAPQPRVQEDSQAAAAAQAAGGQEDSLWRKMKVRFQDMTGQLTGHRRRQEARTRTRSSFRMQQERPREQPARAKKPRRDALEIDSYRIEESYLLDSYDRKGEYSRISTKK